MTYQGHIENGVVVLDESAILPDGAKVQVVLVLPSEAQSETTPRTLYERFESIIGKAEGLPADFAEQHNHYIHGSPKTEPKQSQEVEDASPTLYEQLKPIVGTIEGLPPDFAKNHDHYIHGQPKK